MGYSARYHAASLAAVFLALAIGILLGVGLGDNVVEDTTKQLEKSLTSDLADARSSAEDLQAELNREREFSTEIFPALVDDLLLGDRVAVVALGSLPQELEGDIEFVVGGDSPTGARLGEVAVVREPPDLRALADATPPASPASSVRRDSDALSALARRAGLSLVSGGPPFDRLQDALLADVSGRPGGIDAVIIVRDRPSDLGSAKSDATDSLEEGLVDGIQSAGEIPVVGVERSDSDGSQIDFYTSQGLSTTVDSVDLMSGRVALAYALSGVDGAYGIKASADRLLPALRRPPGAPVARPGFR
ncbi:MAG: copper transporter [Actinomycetota bacterium]